MNKLFAYVLYFIGTILLVWASVNFLSAVESGPSYQGAVLYYIPCAVSYVVGAAFSFSSVVFSVLSSENWPHMIIFAGLIGGVICFILGALVKSGRSEFFAGAATLLSFSGGFYSGLKIQDPDAE